MVPLLQTDEIIDRLASGQSLLQICALPGMPSRQAFLRRIDDDPLLADRYARARSAGLDVIAEQIVEISEDRSDDPQSRRVRVDSRKWLLSKMRPDKYGDRVTQQLEGPGGGPVQSNTRIEVVFVAPPRPAPSSPKLLPGCSPDETEGGS
jgi:hypothetical protein